MITFVTSYVLLSMLALLILQVAYMLVMCLQRANDEKKLAPWLVKAGTGFMYVGLVWDVLCNIFIAPAVFLELSNVVREPTVSQRLRRLVKGKAGWRKDLAVWFSANLLNPFSNGGPHIPLE